MGRGTLGCRGCGDHMGDDVDDYFGTGARLDDDSLAEALAAAAGDLLVRLRTGWVGTQDELKAEGDRRTQELLAKELAAARPDDAVLSEEARDDHERRLAADRVWIVDPLDGTREYSEGRADFAVHVALWEAGDLVCGAVALPARGEVLSSGKAPQAAGAGPGPLRLAVSRTRPPQIVSTLLDRLGGRAVPMGSAGVKVVSVVTGESDAYVHAGGQYEWDSAAPVAVARAAGLHTSRIDGSPLRYNQPDPYLPDLLVCRPERAAELLGAIALEQKSLEVSL